MCVVLLGFACRRIHVHVHVLDGSIERSTDAAAAASDAVTCALMVLSGVVLVHGSDVLVEA